ncbi:eukaryotic mitochondrial regulator protein-domain-containing protein [Xylariaceae sp. FL0255]|nr:eukaryotic mitochondrial regulator protein-domain-containing protein [Xylariaceae sp. FL0255]
MPPRIPKTVGAVIRSSSSTNSCCNNVSLIPQQTSSFSTTAPRPKFTEARKKFRDWEKNRGAPYRDHKPGQTNYLITRGGGPGMASDGRQRHPYPENREYHSHPVLDDSSRELIWERVMREGETIKAVSAEFGVDIRRVAAIVRLKEVEKDWEAKNKKLAIPYAKAMLEMLPTFRLSPDQNKQPYEEINELHVHPYTMQQLFWPVSESRVFTREDAAQAFHPTLLSADKRIPHPELVDMEREITNGRPLWDAAERFKAAVMESERAAAERNKNKVDKEEKATTRVRSDRFEFRFKDFNSDNVGPKGKGRHAVGWKYGTPLPDRSKGHQIKIPTSVP